MNNQLTNNDEALRLFFTEPIYLVRDENQTAFVEPVSLADDLTSSKTEIPTLAHEPVVNAIAAIPELAEKPEAIQKKEWNFEFLGKNQKGILILVNDQVNKVSSTEGTELLRKLVKAIALTNNDFALINYAFYHTAVFADLKAFFSCKLVLSFGVDFANLGLSEKPLHQLFETDNVQMIFTKNLHELDSDQVSKKMLWTTLQQLKV